MGKRRQYHRKPGWPTPAEERIEYFVGEFDASLRIVAERFARHEEADNVDTRHVNAAFDAMNRLGLHRTKSWQRPEAETGLGGFLFGLGIAAPDVLGVWGASRVATGTATTTFIVVGAFLFLHAWFRGR